MTNPRGPYKKRVRDQPAKLVAVTKPCKKGHLSPRYASTNGCVACAMATAERHYARKREQILQRERLKYAENPEPKKSLTRQRTAADPERTRREKREQYWRNKPAHVVRASAWAARNKPRVRSNHKKWRDSNPATVLHYAKLSYAERLQRRPPWLTDEHKKQIRRFYRECRLQTKATGVPHNVDHIIPLRGATVSGLHVPWNLQVITSTANRIKTNRLVEQP